ncbi:MULTISPECIES: polysaccharide biosynthesis/export family protein [Acidithiobacillus]|uniref:polysaccharide biosynthesis/export family protein n=2 Tax=Acidithiobacillaceae TaxID=225058 RepID=UPI00094AD06B|nr:MULTISPECIES: polysaccharide biosynthesis/export family protein [Acidithiobacillus]MBU2794911.1 hypothetical protein [Acidithiobacillus thiooxidans]MBU2841966.1 hypothetical protein [Acidithiobacillus thiooxidans]
MKWQLYPVPFIINLLLLGCSSLPHSGPSVSAMQHANLANFIIEPVTPGKALALSLETKNKREIRFDKALGKLRHWSQKKITKDLIQPGDQLRITLWTTHLSLSGGQSLSSPLHKSRLGDFLVGQNGSIQLPYLGKVETDGLTLNGLEKKINKKYKSTEKFIMPYTKVQWAPHGHLQGVLISGAVMHPGLFPWRPGGLSIAKILAKSGLKNVPLQSKDKNHSVEDASTLVEISYHHQQVTLPFQILYVHHLRVPSGAHILVSQTAAYKVTLLGGGVLHQGLYSFGSIPNINGLLAMSGGLQSNTADDREIFIMQPSHRVGTKSILYVLRWNTAEGLLSAQRMPLHNGDLVYIPTAPVVPIEKAAQIFSDFLLPTALISNAVK